MSKKSFTDNPAMKFLTRPAQESQEPKPTPKKPAAAAQDPKPKRQKSVKLAISQQPEQPEENAQQSTPSAAPDTRNEPTEDNRQAEKKTPENEPKQAHRGEDPKGNIMPAEIQTGEPPEGYLYKERKSRRVQIVLRPSTYEAARQAAEAAGLSFNKFIEAAILEKMQK